MTGQKAGRRILLGYYGVNATTRVQARVAGKHAARRDHPGARTREHGGGSITHLAAVARLANR